MFFILTVLTLAASTAHAADVVKFDGQAIPDNYIVMLKPTVQKDAVFGWLNLTLGTDSTVTNNYDSDLINAFSGNFTADVLDSLKNSEDVDYIAEDGIMSTMTLNTQTNAPWGLSRVSSGTKLVNQDPTTLNNMYYYDSKAGTGVDIYIVDTGIYTAHPDFNGRATWGATFGRYANADGNGHGTHVAGTAASTTYGVAKAANLIAVKVLSDDGSGAISDVIHGLQYVMTQARKTGRPSIASMSLGGGASRPLDDATRSLINTGVHCTVAAGNSNTDAASSSPARVTEAITVGASDITDARASYSNYGNVVDVFAPGTGVISTWINGGTRTLSGTSMATPHVAGLVAYFISVFGNLSPAATSDRIKTYALQGVLSGVPSGTMNYLANNGYSVGVTETTKRRRHLQNAKTH